MIEISVEARSGDACLRVAARAESIERAVGLAKTRYLGSEVRVLFQTDPESFFVGEELVRAAGQIWSETLEAEAGRADGGRPGREKSGGARIPNTT